MSVSGKKIAAKIGTTLIVGLVSWRVRESSQELDATTGADAGYEHPDNGVLGATIELNGVMDLTSGEYVPIRAGTEFTDLKCYRDAADTDPAFLFPTARVFESGQGGGVKERFEINCTAKSVGSYTVTDPA